MLNRCVIEKYSIVLFAQTGKLGVFNNMNKTRQLFFLPEIIVHIKDVRQERLGRPLLQVELLHLVLHHDRLPGDLLSRPTHSEHPRDPLEEDASHLSPEMDQDQSIVTIIGYALRTKYLCKIVSSIKTVLTHKFTCANTHLFFVVSYE